MTERRNPIKQASKTVLRALRYAWFRRQQPTLLQDDTSGQPSFGAAFDRFNKSRDANLAPPEHQPGTPAAISPRPGVAYDRLGRPVINDLLNAARRGADEAATNTASTWLQTIRLAGKTAAVSGLFAAAALTVIVAIGTGTQSKATPTGNDANLQGASTQVAPTIWAEVANPMTASNLGSPLFAASVIGSAPDSLPTSIPTMADAHYSDTATQAATTTGPASTPTTEASAAAQDATQTTGATTGSTDTTPTAAGGYPSFGNLTATTSLIPTTGNNTSSSAATSTVNGFSAIPTLGAPAYNISTANLSTAAPLQTTTASAISPTTGTSDPSTGISSAETSSTGTNSTASSNDGSTSAATASTGSTNTGATNTGSPSNTSNGNTATSGNSGTSNSGSSGTANGGTTGPSNTPSNTASNTATGSPPSTATALPPLGSTSDPGDATIDPPGGTSTPGTQSTTASPLSQPIDVPEPAALLVFTVGAAATLLRRHRL